MFSLLWSEHCAYKHSRKLLRRLPTEGERVVMGPGENAGAVDVGNGYAVAFKVESHNHPSAVEPFQGAATGVGGILRDVFALGARPIAILDCLRFGELDSVRSRHLLDGAVRGIGHYGNSIGVPTVGGEIYFEEPYEHNCLVNAMCVGLAKQRGHGPRRRRRGRQRGRPDGRLDRARRDRRRLGAGLGRARRGRRGEAADGADRRPLRGVEGARVLPGAAGEGAAGLAAGPRRRRASPPRPGEMASAGGVGIDLDVARVPLREADMEPFEIMVSESQERMLGVVEPARVAEVLAVCEKWQTGVGGDRRRHRQRPGPDPARRARSSARCRSRRWSTAARSTTSSRPSRRAGSTATGRRSTPGASAEETLLALLASPSIASKRWAFEQYDSVVGSRTVRRPESADAAVLQLPEAGNAIAVSIDGNGRRVACDPYAGTIEAVLECAQNLACVGAEPLGLTNCLNFGNPEKPAPAWQLDRAVSGLADACEALGVPVVGGNVSLYNEGPEGPIYPTPVVGMVGELPDPARVAGSAFAARGRRDRPARPLRPDPRRLGAGEAARRARHGPAAARHRRGRRRLRDGPRRGPRRPARLRPRRQRRRPRLRPGRVARSAAGIGCRVDLQPLRERGCSPEEALFGEGTGGFLVSGERAALEALGATLHRRGRRRRRSRSPPATAASPSASATPSAPGARWPRAAWPGVIPAGWYPARG